MGRAEQIVGGREKLLTTREVSNILGVVEKDIIEMTKNGRSPHYKVAGEFLRFRKAEIIKMKDEIQNKFSLSPSRSTFGARMREFFYFNDFYILSAGLILFLVWFIFKS